MLHIPVTVTFVTDTVITRSALTKKKDRKSKKAKKTNKKYLKFRRRASHSLY